MNPPGRSSRKTFDRRHERTGVQQGERWAMRLVLVLTILAGLGTLAHLLRTKPDMLGVNMETYRLAGETLGDSSRLYGVAPSGYPDLQYVYPPLVAVAFWPMHVLHPALSVFAIHLVGSLIASVATGLGTIWLIEQARPALPTPDRVLVVLGLTLSPHAMSSYYYGNINPHLILALLAALILAERHRDTLSGFLLAIPGLIKVFPGGLGLWLVWRRSWRGCLAAVGTGLATAVVSLAVFGIDLHRTYVQRAVLPRRRTELFVGGLDPGAAYVTLRRPLSQLLPASPELLSPLAVGLLIGPVAVACYTADSSTTRGRLMGFHAIAVGILLALPSYAIYVGYAVPSLFGLCYILPHGRGRWLLILGTGLSAVAVTSATIQATLGGGLLGTFVSALVNMATPQLIGLVLSLAGVISAGVAAETDRRVGTP